MKEKKKEIHVVVTPTSSREGNCTISEKSFSAKGTGTWEVVHGKGVLELRGNSIADSTKVPTRSDFH